MASSNGTTTLFCTVSALAPVYEAMILTVGGAISGNCSNARRLSPMMPTSTISTEITPDNIGRSIKVLTFTFLPFYFFTFLLFYLYLHSVSQQAGTFGDNRITDVDALFDNVLFSVVLRIQLDGCCHRLAVDDAVDE